MKRLFSLFIAFAMIFGSIALFTSCEYVTGMIPGAGTVLPDITPDDIPGDIPDPDCDSDIHIDLDHNNYCDECNKYLIVFIDFYVFNDLHGKFCDTADQPGVDEFGSFIEDMSSNDDNIVLLSSGDMWQGSAESILSDGGIIVEWMNLLGFEAMTLGNHEFDWGEEAIRNNLERAEFPFLAINIYDNSTGKLADYCTPSIMIEREGIQIGVIGAIGDCYSSISADMVEGVNFKVGAMLEALIEAESVKLREAGADIIVLSMHDGQENYFDSLSDGYVDIVFEGHTHQSYVSKDSNGVYHVQGGGENYGISHAEIAVNSANGMSEVTECRVIPSSSYSSYEDHAETEELEDKYSDIIDYAYSDLGVVSKSYSDSEIEDYMASLYLEAGIERWSEQYDVVLGGGFLKTRSPYDLSAGVKKYADLLSLFPFNNRLVLCSISGRNLKDRFINNSSYDYHVALKPGFDISTIVDGATYYVVVDSYTSQYKSNRLTVVDYYDETTYARDLLADAIKEGRLQIQHDSSKQLTSIPDALAIGGRLNLDESTVDYYYIKGTVNSTPKEFYGNLYLVDEDGNEIYVYGLYDSYGNRYGNMEVKPKVGDTIVVYSTIYKYKDGTIELKDAVMVSIEQQ